jgi:hypothetical protein
MSEVGLLSTKGHTTTFGDHLNYLDCKIYRSATYKGLVLSAKWYIDYVRIKAQRARWYEMTIFEAQIKNLSLDVQIQQAYARMIASEQASKRLAIELSPTSQSLAAKHLDRLMLDYSKR